MGRFKLTAGFQMIPEGKHVFRIDEVVYDEDFGKMDITMVTKSGQKHIEHFRLLTADGEVNEGAMRSFGYFAHAALNDFGEREIDEQELVGRYISCEVIHNKSKEPNPTTGEYRTFVNLGRKEPADGFEGESPATDPAAEQAAPASSADDELRALLGL